jgi:hypothetical protein
VDRPAGWWPQGDERPEDLPPVPTTLDWDTWRGPVPFRSYNPVYAPFKWRGRWDFVTGAIGDMGVHDLEAAYWALDLGVPTSASVSICRAFEMSLCSGRTCSPGYSRPCRTTAPAYRAGNAPAASFLSDGHKSR